MSTQARSYISVILAEKVMEMFESSGASEVEKLSALDIARCLVPLAAGSVYSKSSDGDQASGESFRSAT